MLNVKQQGALSRLEAQLKSGEKTVKGTRDQKESLSDKDIIRISTEIKRLKDKNK